MHRREFLAAHWRQRAGLAAGHRHPLFLKLAENLRTGHKKAEEFGLDLIEISPGAIPPVAKIADYGKFQYDENKNPISI